MTDINIGALSEALNNKVDLDLLNINPVSESIGRIASWSFPTDEYEVITLGESGTEYTAPNNGYVYVHMDRNSNDAALHIISAETGMSIKGTTNPNSSTDVLVAYLPVKTGQKYVINYYNATSIYARFIPACGDGTGSGSGGGTIIYGGGGIPDYASQVNITSLLPYTTPSRGVVYAISNFEGGSAILKVNGYDAGYSYGYLHNAQSTQYAIVDEGDVVSSLNDNPFPTVIFIPFKDLDTLGNRYLGQMVESFLPIEDSSLHLLDGAELEYTGIYKNFIDSIGDLYESGEKKSKIEKIGNLVDNNGIISNFSVSNYGVIPVLNSKLALASSWEIGGKFNVSDFANVPSGGACIFANNFGASSNRSIYIIASTHSSIAVFLSESGGTTWDIADNEDDFNITNLTANTDYWYRLKYTGSSYILELSTDGITYSQTKTLNKSAHIYSEDVNLFLGDNHTGSMYFPGSIDLNACYVNIEGQRYWAGREVSWATSELKWQESISIYGSCGKFVYDSVNQTVRLPKVSDIIQGTSDINALGDLTEAGAPNITGIISGALNGDTVRLRDDTNVSGAFAKELYPIATKNTSPTSGSGNSIDYISFDASRSSSIYGNSDTVQPQTIKALYYMVVATGSREEVKLNFDAKADKDLVNTGFITNCITQIPQDINLELSNGTLTLKSESTIYYFNGLSGSTQTFTKEITNTDYTCTLSGTSLIDGTYLCWITANHNLVIDAVELIKSGTSFPSNPIDTQKFYKTDENKIYRYSNNSWDVFNVSLPLGLVSVVNNTITSILKVFNGFGYIGNITFILPDVECLLPNGRNPDGTMISKKFKVPSVIIDDFTQYTDSNTYVAISDEAPYFMRHSRYVESEEKPTTLYTLWYDTVNNETYYSLDTTTFTKRRFCYCNRVLRENSTVINMNSSKTFKAVDDNKADYVIAFQKPTPENNYRWYRLYKSGWLEQGGYEAYGNKNVFLVKDFADTNYSVITTFTASGTPLISCGYTSKTVSQFWLFSRSYSGSDNYTGITWEAKGMSTNNL